MSSRKLRSEKAGLGRAEKRQNGRLEPIALNPNADDGTRKDDGPPSMTYMTSSNMKVATVTPPGNVPMNTTRHWAHEASGLDDAERSSRSSNLSRSLRVKRKRLEIEIEAEMRLMELHEEEAELKLKILASKRAQEDILTKKLLELAEYDIMTGNADEEINGICDDNIESFAHDRFQPSQEKISLHEIAENEAVQVVREHVSNTDDAAYGTGSSTLMERFLVRQTVGTKLPTFDGDPHTWLMFLSQYEHSTKLCGLSSHENMMRLQEAVKGKAREAVESLLGFPENTNTVMEVLRMNFGRDDQIIKSLIAKAKSVCITKDGRPDSMLSLYNAVNSMVSTMQNLKSDAHLNNPTLLDELVQKLSPTMKSSWAMHLLDNRGSHNLLMFACWLKRWAMAQVFLPQDSMHGFKNSDATMDDTLMSTASSEDENVLVDETEIEENDLPRHICACCGLSTHDVYECSKFKAMSVDERWKYVLRNRYCFLCLGKGHVTKHCKTGIKCSNENCTMLHNILLHNEQKHSYKSNLAEEKMPASLMNDVELD